MKKHNLISLLSIFICSIIFFNSFEAVYANFNSLEKKQTSYLDFLLLKIENKLVNKIKILNSQMFPTRIQYSYVAVNVNYNKKNKKIIINIKAIMDKTRYTKKKYKQKLSDCNVVRNLVFYQKTGYKFFTQKRDPYLSKDIMIDIFKRDFLGNTSLSENEINFLLDNINVRIQIFNPVNKTDLFCAGNVNDYELN